MPRSETKLFVSRILLAVAAAFFALALYFVVQGAYVSAVANLLTAALGVVVARAVRVERSGLSVALAVLVAVIGVNVAVWLSR